MTDQVMSPFRLAPFFSKRVWGSKDLKPWYSDVFEEPVGEAWLTAQECLIETGPFQGRTLREVEQTNSDRLLGQGVEEFPLLVKILFPYDKLSVQVHPNDEDAARIGGEARPKTECWYVLDAAPEAAVWLGLEEGTTEAQLRASLGKPEYENLLKRVPVQTGDMIYVEAGTVHAIGPGLVALEVQQPSDTTYRLYDYGRPRELHLAAGMDVTRLKNRSGKVASKLVGDRTELIAVPHFTVERFDLEASRRQEVVTGGRPECLIPLSGSGTLESPGGTVELVARRAVVVPADVERYTLKGQCAVVRARVPTS